MKTKIDKAEVLRLVEDGKTKREIAKILGVTERRLLYFCKKYNINYYRAYQRYQENLIGISFGILTVESFVGRDKDHNSIWRCKCKCSNIKDVIRPNLIRGYTKSCGCENWAILCPRFEELPLSYLEQLRRGAISRNMDFLITAEDIWNTYIKQNRKCALTGKDVIFTRDHRQGTRTASVDRIRSDLAYTKDNIQIVHRDINLIKLDYDQDYFISLCVDVARYKSVLYNKEISK